MTGTFLLDHGQSDVVLPMAIWSAMFVSVAAMWVLRHRFGDSSTALVGYEG
jgi:hypothetical protein